jgi:putative ABC transport system permease protein
MKIEGREGKIIGVAHDFKYESIHNEVVPVVIYIAHRQSTVISVRIAPGKIRERIDAIQGVWNNYHPDMPLRYTFLDEKLNHLYESERQMMKMFAYFSMLAIFIACLGLIGLVTFATEHRKKEIGVRKVLGASVMGIVVVMTKEFTKWVIIANIIAFPVAYFAMTTWLKNFAYRAELGISVFILSGLFALIISFLTVCIQTTRAAIADPVKVLRYE